VTIYNYGQLEWLWDWAGGPPGDASTAAAIAEAESGGNSLAAYPGTTVAPGAGSVNDATGLWQILGLPAGNFTAAELTDPFYNAEMAVAKYTQAGNSFAPWQTYTEGTYTVQSGVAPQPVSGSPSASGGTTLTSSTGSGGGINLLNPTTWTPANIAKELFGGIFGISGIGADITDILERGALMLFGAILVIIGIIRLSGGSPVEKVKQAASSPDEEGGGKLKRGEEAAEVAAPEVVAA
jgi:hypothetical protein